MRHMSTLREMQTLANNPSDRFTAGRYLQALALAKGHPGGALVYAETQGHWWNDQSKVVSALKSAVAALGTDDSLGANTPVADSFLAAMRDSSVPLRLAGLKKVPMLTRLYVNSTGVVAARMAEGLGIPVLKGDWTAHTLEPVKHGGVIVQTEELIRSTSPVAAAGISDDLAQATAEAENLSFVSPDHEGSVLYNAPNFAGSGSGLANIDADLKQLADMVPGASQPGAAFVMTKETATFLSLVRGSGGANAYPHITPQGGELIGLPVLVTRACGLTGSPPTRIIGLLSPSEIFWADEGRVNLTASTDALLEMVDAPTGDALAGTPAEMVSMFQSSSIAMKAVRESAWYARAGSGAYFVAGF